MPVGTSTKAAYGALVPDITGDLQWDYVAGSLSGGWELVRLPDGEGIPARAGRGQRLDHCAVSQERRTARARHFILPLNP